MPDITWTVEERKRFWRMARAGVWTALIVFAILLLLKVVTLGPEWALLVFLVYVGALWVPVYKFVRMRWPG